MFKKEEGIPAVPKIIDRTSGAGYRVKIDGTEIARILAEAGFDENKIRRTSITLRKRPLNPINRLRGGTGNCDFSGNITLFCSSILGMYGGSTNSHASEILNHELYHALESREFWSRRQKIIWREGVFLASAGANIAVNNLPGIFSKELMLASSVVVGAMAVWRLCDRRRMVEESESAADEFADNSRFRKTILIIIPDDWEKWQRREPLSYRINRKIDCFEFLDRAFESVRERRYRKSK